VERNVEELLNDYREKAAEYARAKARRTYIEEFKKSKFAILMRQAEKDGFKTGVAQEREAFASEEYQQLLAGLESAVEEEERLRYDMKADEMQLEVWRTIRADERQERKVYGT
jgi:putative hemolysin